MFRTLKKVVAALWATLVSRRRQKRLKQDDVDLGFWVSDGQVTRRRVLLSEVRRSAHVAVLGKTGTGKSSLVRYLAEQDIRAGRGFVFFDLHGEATPFLLSAVAIHERTFRRDLSEKLIVVEPADTEFSVGLNFLEQEKPSFVRIAEFAQVLRQRWHLEQLGARTDELLRNSLYVLASNGLTLLELAPLLTDPSFRGSCLKPVDNPEVRQYFVSRFDRASEGMQAVMREPILNKTSSFTADPRFRHIVGQQNSTFSVCEAMDEGNWVVLHLHKGRLGEQALTLGSLFLTVIRNALFSRKSRQLFTIYCDEIQNLVAYNSGLETILSEARKFGVSVVSANQFLDQYPPEMRAAILAVGTHVFFQLSPPDAHEVARALDGGKPLAELLKNLPPRHLVLKSGHEHWQQVLVPPLRTPVVDYTDLYLRSRHRWARSRSVIEEQIASRQATLGHTTDEALHDWE